MFDGKAFGEEMVGIVKGYVDRATAPLLKRIEELEARQSERGEKGEDGEPGLKGEDGRDGKDGIGLAGAMIDRDGVLIITLSDGTARELGVVVGKDGADGKDGRDGIDGKDGADGKDGDPGAPGLDGSNGADGKDGIDGRDGTDGQDGNPGAEGRDGIDGKDGVDGTDGKDGASLINAHIERDGSLVLSLSDGTTKSLGVIVGKDGVDGRDGTDGRDGERGPAGFSLEHFDVTQADDGRTIIMSFGQGDVREEYELEFPVMIDRGVWKPGEFKSGDTVTWAGSIWTAQRDTSAKPDDPEGGWRLAVKRGRDGRDAGSK